jgi:hypothetical protein
MPRRSPDVRAPLQARSQQSLERMLDAASALVPGLPSADRTYDSQLLLPIVAP